MIKRFSKAQMSIFVIISAILVIGAIAFFSISSDSIEIFTDQKSSYKVKEFVESCLELETKQAIDLIGKHGGWLYHQDMIFTDRGKPDIYNRRARGLSFLEKVDMPYWYYYDDANEEFVFNIPEYDTDSEYSLKNQVKKYVEDNIEKECIQSFQVFEDVYEIDYEPRDISDRITVEFDEEDIMVSLDLPLEIHELNTENVEYVDFFSIEEMNKLWIPYHLALDIVTSEAASSFVEKRILDFLAPYQRADRKDLLPPFYAYKMEYDFEPWDVPEVKTLAKRIISSNLRLLQFLNTDYTEMELTPTQEASEFARGIAESYTKDYLSEYSQIKEEKSNVFKQYSDYRVSSIYESELYPTYFSIAPSLGDMILLPRPEALISFIPFFFTEYNAVYEMTLPITFKITSSNENDKFEFILPIEANIDYNTALAENRDVEYNLTQFISEGQSLICDPIQFISANVSLNITDSVDFGNRKIKDPIGGVEDAMVTFNCKGLANCYIMQTEINGKYISENITQLNFRLPINCDPGRLEVYKYGHKTITIDNLDPTLTDEINLGTIDMPSKKTMDLKIKLVGMGSSRFSTGKSLGENDNAFLIFTNLEDGEIVEVVEANYYNKNNLTVDLTLGNYSLEGFVIYNKTFSIPTEEICYDSGGSMSFLGGGDENCFELTGFSMDSWVKGGVDLASFEVTPTLLLQRDEITVNMIEYGVPGSYAELQTMSEYMSNLKGVSQQPYFD